MRDNIHSFFHTMPELIVAQAQAEDFRFFQETSYPSVQSVDSLIFDGAEVIWKKTYQHGGVDIIFRFDQGLRIMFLITTNEDLGALHPAIVRPGRCHANIGFEEFNESEALEWLDAHGVKNIKMPSRNTIAELYSVVENKQIVAQKQKVMGFIG